MSMVGEQATIAPDSALIFSPAANSTRTIGDAPGYKISPFMSSRPPSYSHWFSHHPSVGFAARLRSFFQIAYPELPQNVLRQLIPLRLGIDAKQTRRVQSEDPFLHLARERLVPMLLDQRIRNLEPPKGFDLPLRRTIPNRVCPPEHVIDTKRVDELPKHMRADRRMSRDELRKG